MFNKHKMTTLSLTLALALALLLAQMAQAASITVTTSNDMLDAAANCAAVSVAALPGPDGVASLREAICAANNNDGPDTINFNIPGAGVHTIAPLTALPAMTDDGTVIDGYTQPGADPTNNETPATILIEIDGSNTTNQSGLYITSANNIIRGLAINRFDLDGIDIGLEIATGNVIAGNHLGSDPGGTIDRGNGHSGVYIGLGATNNTVGGDEPAERNVLSGNDWSGVEIHSSGTTGNVVSGNYIGTRATGIAALGNTLGVRVYGGAQNNTIGGDTAGERNVISGNGVNGVHIVGENTYGNIVSGNHIGTTIYGIAPIGNAENGVYIALGAQRNIIGGDSEGERNVISGNLDNGVYITGTATMSNTVSGNYIGTDVTGTAALGNAGDGVRIHGGAHANVIGGSTAGERNIISGNEGSGVALLGPGTLGNTVSGNYIGTNKNGASALGNNTGITVFDAVNNLIGGTQPGQGNLISGNDRAGIFLIDPLTTGNVIAGNLVGTDATGAVGLGNAEDGIDIWQGAYANTVGPGNVIAGNGGDGIVLGVDVSGTAIFGNFIGTDATGMAALGNVGSGIVLDWAPNNTIGGSTSGERNIISGNGGQGILIGGVESTGNVVSGNYIGVNASGAADLGNASDGVRISESAQNNYLGGTTPAERNVISGNDRYGIVIVDSGTMSNTVAGNYIGTDAGGATALGNGVDGIYISAAQNNWIGGDTPEERNVISGNGDDGVAIDGSSGNMISGNYIGINAGGTAALGNGDFGVVIVSAQNNMVGGTTPGERNVIADSIRDGIYIASNASGNVILGNYIGTDASGVLDLGNGWSGIGLDAGTHDNTIGPGNYIVYNERRGIYVRDSTTIANTITQNSIFANTDLGIKLADGAHGGILPPEIITNTAEVGSITIHGTACPGCTVEIFANDDTDGEGKFYLGSAVANGSGNFTLTMSSPAYPYLTATATDAALGTSEFSAVYTATIIRAVYLPLVLR
jgi:titin